MTDDKDKRLQCTGVSGGQSTMSNWRGQALGVGQGGANLGRIDVEAPPEDSVPDTPNSVVGPTFNLSAHNGRQT